VEEVCGSVLVEGSGMFAESFIIDVARAKHER
jgi:hypothetical protein